jgi:phosphoribosylformylglycinamidine cyclo-ligase
MSDTQITYASAGVNIDAGEELVHRIKPLVRKTFSDKVLTDIGGFGGLYDGRFPDMKSPVLVSSTDGVGTKIKIAIDAKKYDTVGQDLVNHCVDDILVCGARPIFFLDYFASGKLNVDNGVAIVSGFAKACEENGCALIGGETAEMPGIYAGDDFDLAGTVVGVVEKEHILSRENVAAGDILIGLPSTGLHTNGFSLARKALVEKYGIDATPSELGGETIGEALLKVHRSYLHPIMHLFTKFTPKVDIHALSHITGGGIVGNTSRVLTPGLSLDINWDAWERPAIFSLIQKAGNVPEDDIRRALNLGIGLIIIAPPSKADAICDELVAMNERPIVMGTVVNA